MTRVAGLAVALAGLWVAGARAQVPGATPWRPSPADSAAIWGRQALDVLEKSTGSSLGPQEVQAFAQLDRVARQHFARLGPRRMQAAAGLLATLDTLGHRAVVRSDPQLPAFTLVQFLHPTSDAAVSLCYLYWFRGIELLSQAVNLQGGVDPDLRVYWLQNEQMPYEVAILYRARPAGDAERRLLTFRLAPDASGWLPLARGAAPLTLGVGGDAVWVAPRGDALPEIAVWSDVAVDPVFDLCQEPACPRAQVERHLVRHETNGFQIVSERPAPSALNAFLGFVQALQGGRQDEALRLTTRREVLDEARKLGLDRARAKGAIRIASNRCRLCWPERLGFSIAGDGGASRAAEVVFETDGKSWKLRALEAKPADEAGGAPAGGSGGTSR